PPRIELLGERSRPEPELRVPDGNDGPVHGDLVVHRTLHHLLEPGSEGEDRLAGAGVTVERDDADLRIEQEIHGELLLLGARPDAPRFEMARQRLDDAVSAAYEDRLLPGA